MLLAFRRHPLHTLDYHIAASGANSDGKCVSGQGLKTKCAEISVYKSCLSIKSVRFEDGFCNIKRSPRRLAGLRIPWFC